MVARIVKLGSARSAGEGTRIGTVRRPPRGVPKSEFASQNWYDVWFPQLAPSVESVKLAQDAKTPRRQDAIAVGSFHKEVPGRDVSARSQPHA